MNYWPMLGVLVVVVGFAMRWNPIAVVVSAGLASGLAAGMSFPALLALIGESFVSQRTLSLIFLTLPVIGVLEWAGLREQARRWITGFRGLTLARLLVSYLGLRQGLSMIGLTNIAGHAQTVRPLLAPMSEAAVEKSVGAIAPDERQKVLALAAATDNVGLFFGEDVFLAFGGVLLIQGFLAQNGYPFEPLQIALWALPTAIAAFVIHALRVWLFQRRLMAKAAPPGGTPMLRLEYAYWLVAAFFAITAWINLRQRRWVPTAFWSVLALLFAGGDLILAAAKAGNHGPGQVAGLGVLLLAALAPWMQRGHLPDRPESERMASAERLGARLFLPALLIPAVTVAVVLLFNYAPGSITWLVGETSPTLVGLALACVVAGVAAVAVTGAPLQTPALEGRRLLDTLGWAALLPQLLAGLGAVFAATGVGDIVASAIGGVIPTDSRLACVLAYGLGMVVFTMIMGNAFAAFPIMTAGIALPLLVGQHGAHPAVVAAIGMVTGYCGTLMTPMAANYNIVPAALLELDDPNGVIRAQLPTALPLLAVNLALMYWLAFR